MALTPVGTEKDTSAPVYEKEVVTGALMVIVNPRSENVEALVARIVNAAVVSEPTAENPEIWRVEARTSWKRAAQKRI